MIRFCLCLAAAMIVSASSMAADSHVVANGATSAITEHSVCQQVTNSTGSSIMVPTKSASEWSSFRSNLPTGVSLSTCVIIASVSNGVHLNAQSYFSASDWSSSVPKRLIVPAGVTVGSTNTGIPALRTGSGRGGTLEIIVDGEVQGAGGAANSGAGGTAFHADQSVSLTINGAVRGGGGGGGSGGAGGGGSYSSSEDSGWLYNSPEGGGSRLYVSGTYNQYKGFWWYGSYLGRSVGNPATLSHGGYTYYMGATRANNNDGNAYLYNIRRTRNTTTNTNGGAGGNGGRGQGYGQSLAGGSAGAGGGTNAGTGGAGGSGRTWGVGGNTGANGTNGNRTGGLAGSGGGAGGAAISGSGNVSLINNGTINGSQI